MATKTKTEKKATEAVAQGAPLLVTTAHKGVFFGYGTKSSASEIELTDARMCVYWSNDMQGVLGLASKGPSRGCKVGPKVQSIVLRDVTAVTEVSPEAVANWEKGPWA